MRKLDLVRRGLVFHARAHAATLAGVAVTSAALVGALAVGDSVRASLRRAAELRLGHVDALLGDGQRFFEEQLSARVAGQVPGLETANAIQLPAVVATQDGSRRVADVQLLGVDAGFFALGPSGRGPEIPAGGAWLGAELARQLAAKSGDELVLRTERPSGMTRELALSSTEEAIQPLRVSVTGILDDADFGLFALQAGAGPAANLFVERAWLARTLNVTGRANRCFLRLGAAERAGEVERALAGAWRPADVGLTWKTVSGAQELRSDQVFLSDPIVRALDELEPAPLAVLGYFVNALEHGERSTPYSIVAALGALAARPAPDLGGWRSSLPALGADEIVLNDWTAHDLAAAVGDEVVLRYYVMGVGRALEERRHAFHVRAVIPTSGWGADPTLMPDFPGISDATNCRDWDPGIPLELDAIRDQDEEYWDLHRGAPKAFVGLETARALWANRFGSLTAVRVAEGQNGALEAALHRLPPGELGLPVRTISAEVQGTSDFGGLFLGLSFFLIVSSLLLTALFFAFSVERRAAELGVLRVTGFTAREVAWLQLGEALGLALAGVALGGVLGLSYTRFLVLALEGWWRGAVGRIELVFEVRPETVLAGVVLALVLSLGAVFLVLRRSLRTRATSLLWGELAPEALRPAARWRRATGVLPIAAGLACVLVARGSSGETAAALSFAGGALFLGGGLLLARASLARPARAARSTLALGWSNAARRPARSLTTIALVASSIFLLVVAGGSRQGPTPADLGPHSGTGGFEFLGRTSLAVLQDLSSPAGRESYGLGEVLAGVELVPLRVREGDETSCLNLDRPKAPRLLGVTPRRLSGRFSFAAAVEAREDPWQLLDAELGDGVVPVVVDATSLQWTLHRSLGDELELVDGRGRSYRARIVATLRDSILQGDLVLGERAFERLYPDEAGHRAFLVETPAGRESDVAARLQRALADEGLALVATRERLDLLHGVQNTYLAIFQALGGLGLLLGSAGLLALVLRSAIERRAELALLRALGFTRGELRAVFLGEHGALCWAGLALGCAAGACVLIPTPGALSPAALGPLALWIALVAGLSCVWVVLGSAPALRGSLLEALGRE